MRLVYIALGWSAGIILSAAVAALTPPVWAGLSLICLLAALVTRRDARWRMAFIVLLFGGLGGLRFSVFPRTSDVASYNNRGGMTIEGVVDGEPDVRDQRVQVRVAAQTVTRASETLPTSGVVLVYAPTSVDVHYGDLVRATGLLITPGTSDTFSYSNYLARSGVFSVMDHASLEVVSGGHGSPFFSTLFAIKDRAQAAISRTLPEPQAGLLSGILLGNQRGIAPDVQDAFTATGSSHVIAISGFNMAVISGVLMALLKPLATTRRRRWIVGVAGIFIIGIYTLFVGANAAVVRAAIMSSLLVIAPLLRRKTFVPASLAFVLMLMSLQNPTILWDVSFQLSFFAVLGLTLYVEPFSAAFDLLLKRIFPHRTAEFLGKSLNEPLVVSLAAQVFTLPLIIVYFGRLSLVAMIVNVLIIPVQAPLMLLGGLAVIIALVLPVLALPVFWLALVPLSWTIDVVRLFARLPFANAEFYIDPRLVVLYFAVLIGAAMLRATQPTWSLRLARFIRRQQVVFATTASGVAVLVLVAAAILSRPDGTLHVWMLDMGHSNAVLVQTPSGAHMLVDGGQYPSRLLTAIGDRLPFYDRQIDVLAVTQPDEADIGALNAVVARYDIGVALMTGQPNLGDVFLQLQDALARGSVVNVRAGYTLDFGDGTHLEVMNPLQQPDIGDSFNDSAMVLRLTYGDISFLLTSDLSKEAQGAMLAAGEWPLATVLQLPRHGTIDSLDPDFLAAVQPQTVLLESDPANRIGDPNPDTLKLLGDTPLFRTDQGGTIHLWTDGHSLREVQDG